VDLRAGLNELEKRKFLAYWDSNSDPSVVQSAAVLYTDYPTTTLNIEQS
jgi:hypothetical protein